MLKYPNGGITMISPEMVMTSPPKTIIPLITRRRVNWLAQACLPSPDRDRIQSTEHIRRNAETRLDIGAAGREREDAPVTDYVAHHIAHVFSVGEQCRIVRDQSSRLVAFGINWRFVSRAGQGWRSASARQRRRRTRIICPPQRLPRSDRRISSR